MPDISIKIEDKEVSELFDRLIARTNNLSPCMKTVAQIMKDAVKTNFREGGRPQSWIPSRRARETGGQTLIKKGQSGGLLGSITSTSDNTSATVGTNKEYAAIHNFGGVIRARNAPYLRFKWGQGDKDWASKKTATIPARPFMLIPAEEMQEIRDTILDYLID